MNMQTQQRMAFRQRGASLVEFSIIALGAVFAGLFTLQVGLLYHAKTTLNYATFEAARVGAVNNASRSAMKAELGIRLAPLQGGDGTEKRALIAITKSSLAVNDPLNTKITVLNPSRDAFTDWQVQDPVTGKYFIPVNQLRHQKYSVGKRSGLSLRDANLLKLQVNHGVDMKVPVVGKLMTRAMILVDRKNAVFYLRGKWPIQSVATVRMQSDAMKAEVFKSSKAVTSDSPSGPVLADGSNDTVSSTPEDVVARVPDLLELPDALPELDQTVEAPTPATTPSRGDKTDSEIATELPGVAQEPASDDSSLSPPSVIADGGEQLPTKPGSDPGISDISECTGELQKGVTASVNKSTEHYALMNTSQVRAMLAKGERVLDGSR